SLRRRFEWASSLDEDLRKALVAVVAETVAERDRLVHDPAAVPRPALVAAIDGELAELGPGGAPAPAATPTPGPWVPDPALGGWGAGGGVRALRARADAGEDGARDQA